MRRYEILLPLRFNDGSPVPDDLVGGEALTLCLACGSCIS